MQVRTNNSDQLVEAEGSVRIDLLGGTLDLYPLCHLFQKTYTLNMATNLKAKVSISKNNSKKITLVSKNYQSEESYPLDFDGAFYKNGLFNPECYGSMTFALLLVNHFKDELVGLDITLDSNAPAGSGLGGSSSLGVTLVSALSKLFKKNYSKLEIIEIVKNYESMILNQGVPGYQDYYPAMFGGILSLESSVTGVIKEQLFQNDLKNYLEKNLHLVSSNQSRQSGINNWEVYKNFFDGDKKIREGMNQIAKLSHSAYQAINDSDYDLLLNLVKEEGEIRGDLFPGILTPEMKKFSNEVSSNGGGVKICGAGGGGCFLVIGQKRDEIEKKIAPYSFDLVDFKIEGPDEKR